MAIKTLVTGAQGQLGSEIRDISTNFPQFDFAFVDVAELDLTDKGKVSDFITKNNFRVIINCAAFTAVDVAEDQQELAFAVNAEAVRTIAEICKQNKIRLIHISTDYVFDGESNQPMAEDDSTNPLSVYGVSKLKGEQHVQSILEDAYIIRTAWVYSTYGKNFVKTIANLGRQRPELRVVDDQIGTPTYAYDLAAAILEILTQVFSSGKDVPGIYHYTNEGVISWYDLAHFILKYYNLPCVLKPIPSEEYKTRAVRPKFSLLSKRKIRDTFAITPPHWHDSLMKCLEKMQDGR